jgi:hypothetical protein
MEPLKACPVCGKSPVSRATGYCQCANPNCGLRTRVYTFENWNFLGEALRSDISAALAEVDKLKGEIKVFCVAVERAREERDALAAKVELAKEYLVVVEEALRPPGKALIKIAHKEAKQALSALEGK